MDVSFFRDFIAGWTAGMLGLLVGHPCDTIKTYQQVQNISLRNAYTKVWRRQGIQGFYRGVASPMLTNGISNSVFFGCYTSSLEYMCKNRIRTNPGKTAEDLASYWEVFLGGLFGGFAQTIVSNPVELVKTQMQVMGKDSKGQYSTTWKVIRKIYAAKGIRGFGIGYSSLLARDLHGNGVYTLSYVYLLDRAKSDAKKHGDTLPNPLHLFVAGGFAGQNNSKISKYLFFSTIEKVNCGNMEQRINKKISIQMYKLPKQLKIKLPIQFTFSIVGFFYKILVQTGIFCWWVSLPMDVVKSRLQAQSIENPIYKGFVDCANQILKNEGASAFTKGFLTLTIRAFPVNGVIFFSYELIRLFFDKLVGKKVESHTHVHSTHVKE